MKAYPRAALITAVLLLAGCAQPAQPTAAPAPDPQVGTVGPAVPSGPDPAAIVELPQPGQADAPTTVALPGIGSVPVVGVGVEADGQAQIPSDISTVGWYSYGSAPGDGDGSVVLMGHRDGKGRRGALFDLANVPVGATVEVADAAGTTHRYTVVANDSISKQALPLADLFTRDGPPRLVVISCGGDYVKGRGYLDNVVLTAERAG